MWLGFGLRAVLRGLTWVGVLDGVEGGARTQLWGAVAVKEEVRMGYYWSGVGVKEKGSAVAQRVGEAERLWEWTETEFERRGF